MPTAGNPAPAGSEPIKAILLLNSQPAIIIESFPTGTNAAPSSRPPSPPVVAKPMPWIKTRLEIPPPVRWGLNE
jgi:hypothetical protein